MRNNRSGGQIIIQLQSSDVGARSQAYFKVVQDGDMGTLRSGVDGSVINGADVNPLEVEKPAVRTAQSWCDDSIETL